MVHSNYPICLCYGPWTMDHGLLTCSRASSSTGRSSPSCCRSSSPWRAASRVFNLPLAQYPQITPPSITVSCTYPGASAQVVAESVAAPIEQQVNGVEDMIYMSSQSANDGSYSLTRHLQAGREPQFRPGAGAKPGQPRPAAPARRGEADRRHHAQTQPRHPSHRQHLLAQRPLRPALRQQLRHHSPAGRGRPRGRRRRRATCSASRTTACASGWTPTGWPRGT